LIPVIECNTLTLDEGDRFATILCGDTEYIFDKPYGRISSIKKKGNEFLTEPVKFKMWHAPTYNRGSVDEWIANHLHHVAQKTYSTEVTKADDSVVIKTAIALGGPANPPIIKAEVVYTFTCDGSVDITFCGDARENAPILPRLGFELVMNKENEDIVYFGLGKTETYPDRYKAGRFGEYSLTVTDNFVHYVRPQENSSHYKTRRATVGKKGGYGIYVEGLGDTKDFSFNASHYSAEQLTEVKHDFELKEENVTYFNIDGRFNPISEHDNLVFKEKHIEFGLSLKIVEM
ncbi:MAG: hypothetical protein IJO44_01075, partial [Clostridia bacterium]|nr:hypothetical protein [Clostridia bacterium]